MAKATLLVIQGIDQGARFELSDQPVGLGRDVVNTVCLHDTEISRCHARIDPANNGGFVVSDLNSSNGTFVNGDVIRSREIDSGDQIQLGRSILVFSQAGTSTEEETAAKIAFLPERDTGDLSSIVSSIGHDATPDLLNQIQSILWFF